MAGEEGDELVVSMRGRGAAETFQVWSRSWCPGRCVLQAA